MMWLTVALATHYILDATRALRAVRSARKSGTVGLSCATHMAAPRVYMPLLHRRKHDMRILLCFHSGSLTQITSHGYSARRRLAWCPLPLSAHSSRRRWNASFGAVSSYVPCCGDRLRRSQRTAHMAEQREGASAIAPFQIWQVRKLHRATVVCPTRLMDVTRGNQPREKGVATTAMRWGLHMNGQVAPAFRSMATITAWPSLFASPHRRRRAVDCRTRRAPLPAA